VARKADRSVSNQSAVAGAAAASPAVAVAVVAAAVVADVAAVVVADVAAAVVAAGDVRRSSMGMPKSWPCTILAALLWFGVAQAAPAKAPEPQRSFASAEEAVEAFVAALRDQHKADLRAILGPEGDRVVDSGDRYADQESHHRFLALFDEKHAIDQKGPGRAELDVGPNDWPFPIPLVERSGRWIFDTKEGAQTVVDRRIGRNELSAIRTLLACVDAQRDYFARAKQATGRGVYATRLVSTPGRHDGLYWPVAGGEVESRSGR
jgi:Protein of unknown function (DUF2950)